MFRKFVKVVFKYILSFTIRSYSDCLHSSNRPYLVIIFMSSKLLQYESSLLWLRQMCLLYMRNNLRHFLFAFDHLPSYSKGTVAGIKLSQQKLKVTGSSRTSFITVQNPTHTKISLQQAILYSL